MEPSSKKRRLAPKVEPQQQPQQQPHAQFAHDQPHPAQQQHFPPPPPPPPPPAPVADGLPPNPQRNDFESFARHLQDAAMMIYTQTNNSPYASVSALMMRWEEDTSMDPDMAHLEHVLRERYNYHTERWNIPTCANPSIKLGVQVASFLENARPDHLLLIYYAGHGYMSSENQLFWACNPREDAAKIKWNGIRCLFEDAQSDILLLLDTCAIQDAPVDGSHGTKQALAACAHDKNPRELGGRSFTSHLSDALLKFSTAGRTFTVNRLFEELTVQKQQDVAQTPRLANGNSKAGASEAVPMPISFPLTPGKPQGILLAPLRPKIPKLAGADAEPVQNCTTQDEASSLGAAVADLMFDEPRALVCTTFVGDASADMSSFNQWLHNAPPIAPKIKVEGMFIGPPTILIVSMPQSVWNVVQNEKVCLFLGHISTHNITHLYQRLMGSVSKEMEDGRILLEARQAAAAHHNPADALSSVPNTPRRPGEILSHTESVPRLPSGAFVTGEPKDEVEDSAEMQEAAEQLKALSHVRHMSDGSPATAERSLAHLADNSTADIRQDDGTSSHDSGADEIHYNNSEANTPTRPAKARRTLLKQRPSQETRCNLCSHAPFKDSSSLRKHIAAAHTRPFPCAFSFAGCTSTFGSKNEWKRHIASQHLCLQYYRCSSCLQNAAEGKGNEFNRKDLFTQHLRRMHAPFAVKKSLVKGDSKINTAWENHVKEMQTTCLVTRRKPPQRSACPKPDCQSVFEGPGSWDEWTEHVGRHMEKGEGQRMGVDKHLAKWALEENIIERKEGGEYRLCSGNGMPGGDKDMNSATHNTLNSQPQRYPEAKEPELQLAMEVANQDKMVVED
ncbi:C2H2 finger domain-containing protein [Zalerion maritima]|uniref:C2H2 finger domain-containing protein n=1 Tax=Zalerion maritima TaxID=339359 RepID=A0AAD5RY41_9PEZI|nr:C2H2 finger domain-containing protein [Zalerion maritima]